MIDIKMRNEGFIRHREASAGFTLVELIIVIAILGVLAVSAIAILNPFAQFQKGNDVRRKSDLAQIQRALESFYQDYGFYPTGNGNTGYRMNYIDKTTLVAVTVSWGSAWQPYINVVPQDPSATKKYIYYSTGQSYYIYASLDRGSSDSQACNGGNACTSIASNGIASFCGSGAAMVCNYGVSSPDVKP
jgi:prepilin-type N-terminal cleavage/methylation domain-containing protein